MSALCSAICLTYGRAHILGESIQSFLDQDYPNKELIIVNDHEGFPIKLAEDYPNVHLYNIEQRFSSLGPKRNFGKSVCKGEYLFVWEDDEISLPWRMTESVKFLENNPEVDVVNPISALMSVHNDNHTIVQNNLEGQFCIRRNWFENHTYPEFNNLTDQLVFIEGANYQRPNVDPLFWYIYRWGMNNIYHISGSLVQDNWERARLHADKHSIPDFEVKTSSLATYWLDATKFLRSIRTAKELEEWEKRIVKYL